MKSKSPTGLLDAQDSARILTLQNKIALITGSSRGIGKAIALRFAKEGAKIIVNYYKSELKANELVQEIKKIG